MGLTASEQEDLRIIVEGFFGKQHTAAWAMNDDLLGVVTKMIQTEKSCSTAMDFVPRPGVYLKPDDVRKELKRIAQRVILGGGPSYWVCTVVVKYNWLQDADRAGQGVSFN